MTQFKQPYEPLVPINQRLIPGPLALAFGIATDDNYDSDSPSAQARIGMCKPHTQQRRHRSPHNHEQEHQHATRGQHTADAAAPAAGLQQPPARLLAPAAGKLQQPAASTVSEPVDVQQQFSQLEVEQQPDVNMADAAVATLQQQAAAPLQPSLQHAAPSAAAAAASMQTTSNLSAGGYPHSHHAAAAHHAAATHMAAAHHAAAAAQAASVNAAVMHPLHGYPAAAAYGYGPHAASLMPYMAAAPQAMAVSNITGSMGCPPMSVYSAPADYSQMVQQQEDTLDDNQARALKRPRLVWTPQLHALFEEAVGKLGLEKAVPKTIMQMMNVEGLTRENVASHLQKYRLTLKKGGEPDGAKPAGGSSEAGTGADGGDGNSGGEKTQQQQDEQTAGASAALGAGGESGDGSASCGGGGGGDGSCSSDGQEGSSSKARPEKDVAAGRAAAAEAPAAGSGGDASKAAAQPAQQVQQPPPQQQQQQEVQQAPVAMDA